MRFHLLVPILLLSLISFGGPAGAADPPLFSPSEIMTPDQIRPGMTGYAKSVFKGTKVETYGIKVIGVLRGYDLNTEDSSALLPEAILIRVTSGTVITRNSGIIAGMSGSPVYIKGKLIGAIAFGFPNSKEPIAGVTPITQMAEKFSAPSAALSAGTSGGRSGAFAGRLTTPPDTVLLPASGALEIGGRTITRAELRYRRPETAPADKQTAVLSPLNTPLLVSGLSPRAMKTLESALAPYGFVAVPGGGKAPAGTPVKPVPGSSIGVQLAGGDVDISAFGTVTAIKGNKVLAMGHTAFGSGLFDLPMVTSYVQEIIARQDWSFVMASGGVPIGRWTEDRPYAVKGILGEKAHTIPANLAIFDGDRNIRKSYQVDFCDQRDLTAGIVSAVAELVTGSAAITTEGTLQSEFEVDAPGLAPFKRQNIYSPSPLEAKDFMSMLLGRGSSSPAQELSQVVDTLMNNPFRPTSPSHISFSAQWSKATRAATILQVSSRQSRVRPGDTVDLEVTLQPWKKPRETKLFHVTIPDNAPPGKLQLGIAGGSDISRLKRQMGIDDPTPVDLPGMLDNLAREAKNNQLRTEVLLGTSGLEAEGRQLDNLPQVMIEAFASANSSNLKILHDHATQLQEMPYVISGSEVLDFLVETDQKDKAGRAPLATGRKGQSDLADSLLRDQADLGGDSEGEMTAHPPLDKLADADPDLGGSGDEAPDMPDFEDLQAVEEAIDSDIAVVTAKTETPAPTSTGKSTLRPPQFWTDTTELDFAKGKTEAAAVNSAGKVELAPPAVVAGKTPEMIWPAAADRQGNLYLGTWFDAKVRKLTPQGETSLVLTTKETAVTALACDDAGNVYAGLAPSGSIYRIDPAGKSELLGKVPAPYIWALSPQGEKGILAATGPEGKLFRLSPQGKADLLFTAPDRHIIALASAPEGACYLATYPKGKVYRLSGDKLSPYYETPPLFTALSLAADKTGNLYVGTSPTGQVIQIDPQGKARLLFKSKEKHVFGLWPAPDGSLYAATGPRARLYRVYPNGDNSLVWEDKIGYLVNLTDNCGVLQSTLANAREVISWDQKSATRGSYLSTVYDAAAPSHWGRLTWQGDAPTEGAMLFATRSGSTAFPDGTWSDWTPVSNNYEGDNIASPQSRYLQYRATLCAGPAAEPTLGQVQVSFMPLNRPPDLTLITPAQEAIWSGKKAVKWQATDPDKDNLSYQVFYSADKGAAWTEIKEAEKAKSTGSPKDSSAKDSDPPATKDAAAKPEAPAPEAKPAAKPTSINWDTKQVADGDYFIKVIASDKLSNPKDALTAEGISPTVTVDNTPPVIALDKTQAAAPPPSQIKVIDSGCYVASGEYRVDKGDWQPAFCADGIFDGPIEYLLLDAANLPAGEHTLQVRARDGVGNEATEEIKYKKPE